MTLPRIVLLLGFGLVSFVAVACGGGGSSEPEPTAAVTSEPTLPAETTAADLAQGVVQIVALDVNLDPVWSGSGTVISSDGLILTNAHVVDDRLAEYDLLGVAVISQTDEPPEPAFIAEIVAVDYALDLAVIELVSDLDGGPVDVDLSAIQLGDSAEIELGDRIRILGFPGIGGETITFTEGSVSGFTAQRDIANRAWIKTDATIAGGNSGGLAANDAGEIIGVPTIAGSSETSEAVDCRFVVDTNRDGTIDELDSCVPVGGFINGLRPIALAMPLIEAAQSGVAYVSIHPEPATEVLSTFDTSDVFFNHLVFADGVTAGDEPTQLIPFLPSGGTEVCAFWDYEEMADGVIWEALWFVDGDLDEGGSIIDETWIGGALGNWWVCIFDEAGLPDGLYEIMISVEGELQATDAIYVGGDHPYVEVELENLSDDLVCFVHFSPTDAENWGEDELGDAEIIDPGISSPIFVPAGIYDALLLNCDQDTLLEEYELDFTQDTILTVS